MARDVAAALLHLVALCALLSGLSAQDEMDCVATATAAAVENQPAEGALSSAVAGTLTDTVICEQGAMAQPGAVGGLSVAVALAISEANEIGQNCSADSGAAANIAAELVTLRVGSAMLAPLDDDAKVLATAWLDARGPDVKAAVQDAPTFLGEDGCLNLASLSDGLPTAVELGVVLSDAVQQVIQALQCGNNLVESDDACIWEDRMFRGRCTGDEVAAVDPGEGGAANQVTCLNDFSDCQGGGGSGCSETLRECLLTASECPFC